ncbi:hypothetical protein [Xanthomonas sp. LMC-A-07]|uniref:hypothetical protein n=1 Tax=Xanthomonas sp. LMC-A-07 TaxID=3040329 RepID=UPI002552CFC1|nr:hypothetical protein [Xanthomonas sp. LMC-A-07]
MSGHDLDLQSVGQTNNNHSHLLIKSHSHLNGWIFALGHVFRLELSIETRHLACMCAAKRISYAASGLRQRAAAWLAVAQARPYRRTWCPAVMVAHYGNDGLLAINGARSARTS